MPRRVLREQAEVRAMTVAERRALPYMHPGRADVIGAAAAATGDPTVDQDFAGLILKELNRALFGRDESPAEAASPPGEPPSIGLKTRPA